MSQQLFELLKMDAIHALVEPFLNNLCSARFWLARYDFISSKSGSARIQFKEIDDLQNAIQNEELLFGNYKFKRATQHCELLGKSNLYLCHPQIIPWLIDFALAFLQHHNIVWLACDRLDIRTAASRIS